MPRRPLRRSAFLLALCLVPLLPAAAQAHHDLRATPGEGGPKTAFEVKFTADLSESGSASDPVNFYVVEIRGPRGCSGASAYTTRNFTRGELVSVRVTPSAIKPFNQARQWCPGRYSASVLYCYCGTGDSRPDVSVGSLHLVVRGPVKYAGRTTQKKRIRFSLSADGKQVRGLRATVRASCRGRHGRYVQVGPLAPVPAIRVRRGSFRATFPTKKAPGSLKLSGRLSGGVFRGTLRLRTTTSRGKCHTRTLEWQAR